MEHLSELTLFGVIGVNIVSFLIFCFLETRVSKHFKKKNLILGICLLSVVLIFDFVCMAGFIKYGVAENGAIFTMFVPFMGYFLYDSIKELKETAR